MKKTMAINNGLFKKLRYINAQLRRVELAKSEIEHKESIIVGFFILQYGKLRILELRYFFCTNFCNADRYEQIKRDTNSQYLALAEAELYDSIRSEKRQEWEWIHNKNCNDLITTDICSIFFPRTCCARHEKKHDRRVWVVQGKLPMH